MFGLKNIQKNNRHEQIFFVYKCLGLKDSKNKVTVAERDENITMDN
jgi:hypothetical protein